MQQLGAVGFQKAHFMGLSSLLHNGLGKEVLKSLTSFQRRDN